MASRPSPQARYTRSLSAATPPSGPGAGTIAASSAPPQPISATRTSRTAERPSRSRPHPRRRHGRRRNHNDPQVADRAPCALSKTYAAERRGVLDRRPLCITWPAPIRTRSGDLDRHMYSPGPPPARQPANPGRSPPDAIGAGHRRRSPRPALRIHRAAQGRRG